MIKSLPEQIASRADFHQARLQLVQYAQLLHSQKKSEASWLAASLLEHYLKPGEATDPKKVEALCEELQASEDSLPVVHVTLAARPSLEQSRRLAAWFRQEITPLILTSFHVDPGVLAGAVVRTTNYIHDLSLSSKLLKIKQPISGRLNHA